jgi:hypothetical protein
VLTEGIARNKTPLRLVIICQTSEECERLLIENSVAPAQGPRHEVVDSNRVDWFLRLVYGSDHTLGYALARESRCARPITVEE